MEENSEVHRSPSSSLCFSHIAHTPKDSSALASSWVPRQVVRTWKSETECKSYAKDKENHHIVTPNRAKVCCIDLAVRRGVGPGVYRNFFFSFSQVGTVGLVIWSIYLICGFRSHGMSSVGVFSPGSSIGLRCPPSSILKARSAILAKYPILGSALPVMSQ